MRLINTSTGVLETFHGRNIPPYAILSHTWEDEEVSFSDMGQPHCKNLKGFAKIEGSCKLASAESLQYVWVDTCCIDKTSSAELSEAINSMFRWYQRSARCCVFLPDLDANMNLTTGLSTCRWFTRGWTLQELIAPRSLDFYDATWNPRGSKDSLAELVSSITGISSDVLRHETPLSSLSVAQRMAWAARRETTLVEDRAYSLMGIFGLNMPLLYGEEHNAFRRLQEEIVKSIPDSSIFARKLPANERPCGNPETRHASSIMADSPDVFVDCLTFRRRPSHEVLEFSLSSRGVRTNSVIHRYYRDPYGKNREFKTSYYGIVLPLDCYHADGSRVAIYLKKCGPFEYVREAPWDVCSGNGIPWIGDAATRYIQARPPNPELDPLPSAFPMQPFILDRRQHILQYQPVSGFREAELCPLSRWDTQDSVFGTWGNPDWDWCLMRISGNFLHLELRGPPIPLDYVVIVLRWRNTQVAPQFVVLDYQSNKDVIYEIRNKLKEKEYNYSTYYVLWQLEAKGVKSARSIIVDVPGHRRCVRVAARFSLKTDNSLCSSFFWRMEMVHDFIDRTAVNESVAEPWVFS
jgi:hypothetical protein